MFPTPKQRTIQKAYAAGGTVFDSELKKMAHYRDMIVHPNPEIQARWMTSGENEFGRLFQGYEPNGIKGMDVLDWITKDEVPKHKKVTYPRYTIAFRPEKDEPFRTRITAGGDRLEYDGEVSTQVSTMETFKILLNSVISTKGARMCTGDISNMYLESILAEPEYVRFRVDLIPPKIIEYYNLQSKIQNGFVYARIKKAWYGLKQSGRIAHDDLVDHLTKAGYYKARTEGLFLHKTRDIAFSLVVDDFAIKYTDKADADHLIEHIQKKYKFKVDWDAEQYIGINLKWNYKEGKVILSMEGYTKQALKELGHSQPKQIHYGPSKMIRPDYGQKIQYVKTDETRPLTPVELKFKQRACGKFLFYARAIDNTMLHALNDIASAPNTKASLDAMNYFLNYAACHPNAKIIYRASDMILQADSDAAYLVCPEAKSRAGGYHFLGDTRNRTFNGPILVHAKVIKNVMASAAEAEVAALFMNAQDMVPLRLCLNELGHTQPASPIKTDNSTATGIINNTIKQKRSKAIDMRFYWVRDRVKQGQFKVYWDSGKQNHGDYTTKHHSGAHHRDMRPIRLYIKDKSPRTVQGCIEIMNPNYSPRAMTNPIKKALHTYLPTKAGRRMNMNNIQFLGHMMGRKLLNS